MNENDNTMNSHPLIGITQAVLTGTAGLALTEMADGIGKPLIVLLTIILLVLQIVKASKK